MGIIQDNVKITKLPWNKRSTLFVSSLGELKAADATDKGIAGRNGVEGGVMLSKVTVKMVSEKFMIYLGQQQQRTTFFFILIEQVWLSCLKRMPGRTLRKISERRRHLRLHWFDEINTAQKDEKVKY
jgi:hypothetical protein